MRKSISLHNESVDFGEVSLVTEVLNLVTQKYRPRLMSLPWAEAVHTGGNVRF